MHKQEIILSGKRFLVIDLTEPLSEDTEVFPDDPKLEKEVFSDITITGYQHHIYKIGDHNFHPHGDAPKHQNPDLQNKGFEVFSSEFNHACLIDLEHTVMVSAEDIEPYADILSKKSAVIIRTGYDKHLESNKPHDPSKIPYLNKTAADYLFDLKNLRVIGTDSLTIDRIGARYAHQKLRDRLILESLVHLYEISVVEFDLQTCPIRIVGATGGPVAANAFVTLE